MGGLKGERWNREAVDACGGEVYTRSFASAEQEVVILAVDFDLAAPDFDAQGIGRSCDGEVCSFDADLPSLGANDKRGFCLRLYGDLNTSTQKMEASFSVVVSLEGDGGLCGEVDRPAVLGGDLRGGSVCLEAKLSLGGCVCVGWGDALEGEGFKRFCARPEEKRKGKGSDACETRPNDAEPRAFCAICGGRRKVLQELASDVCKAFLFLFWGGNASVVGIAQGSRCPYGRWIGCL